MQGDYSSRTVLARNVVKFIGVITDLRNTLEVPDDAMFVSITRFVNEVRDMLDLKGMGSSPPIEKLYYRWSRGSWS